jgi:hypothetical protein
MSATQATPVPPRSLSPGSVKPLLHPTERSRLALAVAAGLLGVIVPLVVLAVKSPLLLVVAFAIAAFFGVLLWLGQQLLRARLLGRTLRVSGETFPELKELLDEVAAMLQYERRVDVYVIDKAGEPISMTSYLGTRIILIEGGLVAELLESSRRPQLVFLLGRSIGALKAKHARLDINALRYVSLLILPWYRATTYSGDQIGAACCGDFSAALEATRRLLVGKELASELGVGNVLPQALLVKRRLLPRLIQLGSAEPHITNRYANLICFGRYHDPKLWAELTASLDAEHTAALDQLWQRSPYSLRRGI